MPAEQEKFQQNVSDVLEAVMFENWIRFYFIAESVEEKDANGEPKLIISVPEKGMQKIKELYPRLLSLAESVNGREVTFESSRDAVCKFVMYELEGQTVTRGTAAAIIDSKAFQNRVVLFNTWVQAFEEKLDSQFIDFGTWCKLFDEWCESETGKDIADKIAMGAPSGASN